MEHLPQGVKDEDGCFVYQVVSSIPLKVRSQPNVGDEYKTGVFFEPNDLVSVDLVRPSRCPGSINGPFLRLSDASGWLFEKKYGETAMKRISVQTGLFTFFVDNVPTGISLRHHPVDRPNVRVEHVVYRPMQKIVCDRKVTHPVTGVNYYRVQGTEGWVFDIRPLREGGVHSILLPEELIEEGLQVYECIVPVAIRLKPDIIKDSNCVDTAINAGELVAIDVSRRCPFENEKNGPFLRLTDGSGWVFVRKSHAQLMKRLSIQRGTWTVQIQNAPAGFALRRQPVDSTRNFYDNYAYKPGEFVQCTHMVQASSGVDFYRVAGTDGWIFDRRGDVRLLTVVSEHDDHPITDFQETAVLSPWSPEFVRGVVAALPDNIEEISWNETSRVISFRHVAADVRINVYFTTRTIGTALCHPIQGRTQLFRRNCTIEELVRILQDPRVHTGKGYKRKHEDCQASLIPDRIVSTPHGQGILADQEAETRNRLLDIDQEMEALQKEKRTLLENVRDVDLRRATAALEMDKKVLHRLDEYQKRLAELKRKELEEQKLLQEEQRRREEEQRIRAAREAQQLRDRTCGTCGRVFSDARARNQHWYAVHRIYCEICQKDFQSHHALDQHRDALYHHY